MKVSAVVANGVSSTTTSFVAGSASGVATGSGATGLALRLAAPTAPQDRSKAGCSPSMIAATYIGLGVTALVAVAASLVALAMGIVHTGDSPLLLAVDIIAVPLAFLFIGIVGFLQHRQATARRAKAKAQYQREKAAWDALMAHWNRLYYCRRDDVVFDPATNVFRDSQHMEQLIRIP